MPYFEDPYKQVNYLQQCLSSDKRPIALFIGAGCPMAIKDDGDLGRPLIPDINGITTIVRDQLRQNDQCRPLLEKIDGHFQADGRTDPNVEDMLSHVRALRAVAGNASVRDLTASELDHLDDNICQTIYNLVGRKLPTSETPYHRVAAWVGAIQRERPVEIFTTNYDLLIEQAFEDHRVPYFDGFAGSRQPFFDIRAIEEDVLPARWARLWKLHGSINWYQVPGKGVFRGASGEKELEFKRVIHPSHLKYEESRRMPYLAMVDRLKAFLKQPSATLVLCGYSFRDDHINEVIIQGLQGTQSAIAFGLLFEELPKYEPAIKLSREQSNLTLLARDKSIIGSRESAWHERDAEQDTDEGHRWIEWTRTDSAEGKGKLRATFCLGNFATFAQFLHELIGTGNWTLEAVNAK